MFQKIISEELEELNQSELDALYSKYGTEVNPFQESNAIKKQALTYNMAKALEDQATNQNLILSYYLAQARQEQKEKTDHSASASSQHFMAPNELPKLLKTENKALIQQEADKLLEALKKCDQEITSIYSKMQNSLKIHSQKQIESLEIEKEIEVIKATQAARPISPDAPFRIEPNLKPSQLVPKFDQEVYSPKETAKPNSQLSETLLSLQHRQLANQAARQTQETELAKLAKQIVTKIRERETITMTFEIMLTQHSADIAMRIPQPSAPIMFLMSNARKKPKDIDAEFHKQVRDLFLSIEFAMSLHGRR